MSSRNVKLPVSQSESTENPSPSLESEEVYNHASSILDEELYEEITSFYTEEDFGAIRPNYEDLSNIDKTELAFLLINGDMPEVWSQQRDWRHINEFLSEIKRRKDHLNEDPGETRDYFMKAAPLHIQEAKGSEDVPSEVHDTGYSDEGVMLYGRDDGDNTLILED